MIELIGNWVKI